MGPPKESRRSVCHHGAAARKSQNSEQINDTPPARRNQNFAVEITIAEFGPRAFGWRMWADFIDLTPAQHHKQHAQLERAA